MAWGYYNPRRRYYRRYWYRRRRARNPFRRRRYYRRWVSNKRTKLPKITLKQWQPQTIRKCHIKGLDCICLFNESRLAFNSLMYKESFVPPGFPGGGGFTVIKFTLDNLYTLHKKCYNWWTASNDNLPLCRYLGCKLKCYSSDLVDYVIKYSTSMPATANKLTYPSTQPSMLLMSSQKRIIPSRKTNPRKKPYTIIRIKPPEKLKNEWYFQKEFRNLPLLVLYAAPTSLKHYYINPTSNNNNITINSLNTTMITNRDFTTQHWPYRIEGTNSHYFYEYVGSPKAETEYLAKDIIPLTNIRHYTQGSSFAEAFPISQTQENLNKYCTHIEMYTGNPFVKEHREGHGIYYHSKTGPHTFATSFKAKGPTAKVTDIEDGTTKMQLTKVLEPLIKKYRYNPFRDDGSTTQMYLLKCDQQTQIDTAWNPPTNLDIILEGFPLWLNIWGYVDFQKRLGTINNIDTNAMLVFKSESLHPQTKNAIVPIDDDYLNNRSPYEDDVNIEDRKRWYPQVQYQTQQINEIARTGPGTPKLYTKTSEQITIKYDFYFKWGGNPARMINVENPSKQIVYPMPSDESKTTSLQSPAHPIETLLYSFDERHNELTKKAISRIQQDWDFTNILSSITETTGQLQAVPTFPQDPQKEETEKKEKEALLLQLIEQRKQQQQLRLGIINIMRQLGL
nr:MAG: ORF1 [TTV-like mini virus]UGV34429.1 MAG: ORF1 [TTV-like mini virus]UGV34527.1 MAG: ORF1 [TTV-like mini virus]UGV36212.1 MAG: ORF1 [TTV-like mini virus]UGV36239.1 MAG: ORF1 [TTV-like mini virus]